MPFRKLRRHGPYSASCLVINGDRKVLQKAGQSLTVLAIDPASAFGRQ